LYRRPTGNDLHYRGYDILDFADAAEFEEIAYLLVHENCPTEMNYQNTNKNYGACAASPAR